MSAVPPIGDQAEFAGGLFAHVALDAAEPLHVVIMENDRHAVGGILQVAFDGEAVLRPPREKADSVFSQMAWFMS